MTLLQQKCQQIQEEITKMGSTEDHYRRRTQRLESELGTVNEVLNQTQQEVADLQQERCSRLFVYSLGHVLYICSKRYSTQSTIS